MSALEDRRQRAREAYWDSFGGPPTAPNTMSGAAVEAAIETAIRVQITDEVEAAAERACGKTIHDYDGSEMRAALIAAFEAAGFEVEE